MGFIRSVQRQVAKGRLAAMGADMVNKRLKATQNEAPLWKRVLWGNLAKQGFAAQTGQKIRRNRKLRRVSK